MRLAKIVSVGLLLPLVFSIGAPIGLLAEGADTKLAECKMTYNLKGWSVFYKTATGGGTITCRKSEIIGGTGTFTGARNISELFGSYAQSEAHAGAGKSGDVQAMTKGEVSLALKGTGRGVDIGIAFGKLTIERAK